MMLAHNRARRAGVQAPRPRQPAQRHRQRMADAGAGQGVLPAAQHLAATCAIRCWAPRCSGAAAWRATMRSPGAMRAAPTRSASTSSRTARSPASAATPTGAVDRRRDDARLHRAHARSAVVAAGHTSVVMAMAGVRMPLESYPAAGAGLGAGEAGVPLRGDVEHDPRLHQPVRQGRAGDRRRHRPVRRPISQPAACTSSSTRWRRSASCSRSSAHAHAAQLGRHRRRHAGPLADHRARRRCRASTSIAAGAPAASRRRRARATSSPHTIASDEPHPINAPFTLDRFRTGRLIDEAAAAAVAH